MTIKSVKIISGTTWQINNSAIVTVEIQVIDMSASTSISIWVKSNSTSMLTFSGSANAYKTVSLTNNGGVCTTTVSFTATTNSTTGSVLIYTGAGTAYSTNTISDVVTYNLVSSSSGASTTTVTKYGPYLRVSYPNKFLYIFSADDLNTKSFSVPISALKIIKGTTNAVDTSNTVYIKSVSFYGSNPVNSENAVTGSLSTGSSKDTKTGNIYNWLNVKFILPVSNYQYANNINTGRTVTFTLSDGSTYNYSIYVFNYFTSYVSNSFGFPSSTVLKLKAKWSAINTTYKELSGNIYVPQKQSDGTYKSVVPTQIFSGGTEIVEVYKGNQLVWPVYTEKTYYQGRTPCFINIDENEITEVYYKFAGSGPKINPNCWFTFTINNPGKDPTKIVNNINPVSSSNSSTVMFSVTSCTDSNGMDSDKIIKFISTWYDSAAKTTSNHKYYLVGVDVSNFMTNYWSKATRSAETDITWTIQSNYNSAFKLKFTCCFPVLTYYGGTSYNITTNTYKIPIRLYASIKYSGWSGDSSGGYHALWIYGDSSKNAGASGYLAKCEITGTGEVVCYLNSSDLYTYSTLYFCMAYSANGITPPPYNGTNNNMGVTFSTSGKIINVISTTNYDNIYHTAIKSSLLQSAQAFMIIYSTCNVYSVR